LGALRIGFDLLAKLADIDAQILRVDHPLFRLAYIESVRAPARRKTDVLFDLDHVRPCGSSYDAGFAKVSGPPPQNRESIVVSNLAKIEQDPNYQELVRRRSSLGWMLSLIMLVIYFGFILLVAYAPKFLGTPIGTGVMTIGIPVGLSVIVAAFLLTGIYVRKANSSYDTLIRKIVEDYRS
jgi:uncharacterized membrane protein (DUF485 family)